MNSVAFTTFFCYLQVLALLWSIWQSSHLFRSSRTPVTALLYTFALISLLLSDLYWIAYIVIRPETRMPFAVSAGRYMTNIVSMRFTLPNRKLRNVLCSGIEMICVGTRIIRMTMPNSRFLPLNLNRAKP